MFTPTQKNIVQPQLTIGQPNDKYEQEADGVADLVMRMPASEIPPVRRKCEKCEEEGLQMKPLKQPITPILQKQEEEEEMMQMKGYGNEETISSGLESSLQQSKGNGQSLDASTNQLMSRGIGADFSNVKVHTDSNAIQMNQQLNAKAFTNGSDIYFNRGEYQPDTSKGKRLLAHELTHVVQQSSDNRPGSNLISRNFNKQISRWHAPGNIATSDKATDTLANLAHKVSGDQRDWRCIWIRKMKNILKKDADDYYKYISIGDEFDVSNLKATSGVSATIVFQGADTYLQAINAIYGGGVINPSNPFVNELETLSNHGETPIHNLTLVGHSNPFQMWGDNAKFIPGNHNPELPLPNGFQASIKAGPKRCWFTRNATVKFVGCTSEELAKTMSKKFLRKGAAAYGTNKWLCEKQITFNVNPTPVWGLFAEPGAPPCPAVATTNWLLSPADLNSAGGLWKRKKGQL